jgi:hypothetical protein
MSLKQGKNAVCVTGTSVKMGNSVAATTSSSLCLAGRTYTYTFWKGEALTRDSLAVDTETALIDNTSHTPPPLAMLTASNALRTVVVRPIDAADFVLAHAGCDLIAHNWAFDFHVLREQFTQQGRGDAVEALLVAGDECRLHDLMWLDALYRLALYDLPPIPRDLGKVVAEYSALRLNKNCPFRLRYAETIDADWNSLDEGFFVYAVSDSIATFVAFATLYHQACDLATQHGVPREMIERFGVLTEALQTNAAIALADITRNGIGVDLAQRDAMYRDLQAQIDQLVAQIEAMPEAKGLFSRDKAGKFKMTSSGRPSMDQRDVLQPLLVSIAEAHDIPAPQTSRGITTARKFWDDYAIDSPFVDAYVRLDETAKLMQFLGTAAKSRIHPRYNVLVKTGRSSSSCPNFQQVPRDPRFRSMFVAAPGHLLVTCDYSALELRTLAACCLAEFGHSALAEVFHAGRDPHTQLAASFHGEDYDAFTQRPDFKQLRQRVKAISFGVPGGMTAPGLAAYALASYGTRLTIAEAEQFRSTMIEQTFPELARYLASDQPQTMANALYATREQVVEVFGDGPVLGALRRIVGGRPYSRAGKWYAEVFVADCWRRLEALNRNPDLASLIATKDTQRLTARLFWSPVKSLTGRIRARASYTQSRNFGFQALASDGAKLACWRLFRRGFTLVGFVHDEILVEIADDDCAEAQAETISRIMCHAMEELTLGVPVACEYRVGRDWAKP